MSETGAQPHLYTDLAGWYHMLTIPADYEEEAGIFTRVILGALAESGLETGPRPRLLELGSGGGNNALFMKRAFDCTLSDLSPQMLEVSRTINPELPHHQGDMRSIRLGGQFDAVFIHDAVCYLTSEDDLRAAFATAFAHTRPGGVCLVCPDATAETFRATHTLGGHDGEELDPPQPGRSLRYMEWTVDLDPSDTIVVADFVYLLREGGEVVRCVHDQHVEGLFSRDAWLRLLNEAGFQARAIPFVHSEVEGTSEHFLAIRPR